MMNDSLMNNFKSAFPQHLPCLSDSKNPDKTEKNSVVEPQLGEYKPSMLNASPSYSLNLAAANVLRDKH